MHGMAIVVMCVFAAIAYGILHDQITARVCVEYFTIGHPPVFPTDDPTLLGLGWGIIATWWVGAMLGVPLAMAARAGTRPKRSILTLIRPILTLFLVAGSGAFLAGLIGWTLASMGVVFLVGDLAKQVPADRHVPFLADLWAHNASYAIGFLGGIVTIVQVWRSRKIPSETVRSN